MSQIENNKNSKFKKLYVQQIRTTLKLGKKVFRYL